MSFFNMTPTFPRDRFYVFPIEMSKLLQLGEFRRIPAALRTREQGLDVLSTATS